MTRRCRLHPPSRVERAEYSSRQKGFAEMEVGERLRSDAAIERALPFETAEEEAERLALEEQLHSAFQLAKDVADGVFDPRQVKIIHGVPQIYGYRWRDPLGRTFIRLANRHRD